jgi:hypothetical protein
LIIPNGLFCQEIIGHIRMVTEKKRGPGGKEGRKETTNIPNFSIEPAACRVLF